MRQAIQQRGGQLGIAEDITPLAERQIGRDHYAGVLVKLAQQMEEQGPAGLAEGQVTQLIQNHQIDIEQALSQLPSPAMRFLLFQPVDQFHG